MLLLGEFFQTIGGLLIAYTVIRVHHRVWKEHKIDKQVFVEMRQEQWYGILRMLLIFIGFFMKVPGLI